MSWLSKLNSSILKPQQYMFFLQNTVNIVNDSFFDAEKPWEII